MDQKYSPILVRLSISFIFLWFGINQLFLPEDFMGYLPDFILNSNYAEMAIFFNGLFETIFGTLLLIGFFTRITSLFLGLHLFTIIISLGYNDIAVRDFVLALITFSITLRGADEWCLDKKYW